jgi:SRSO17 transposase
VSVPHLRPAGPERCAGNDNLARPPPYLSSSRFRVRWVLSLFSLRLGQVDPLGQSIEERPNGDDVGFLDGSLVWAARQLVPNTTVGSSSLSPSGAQRRYGMTLTRSISQATLDAYFDGIGRVLGRKERRANFALYAMGLLSKLERKSVEPIAAMTAGDDLLVNAKRYDQLLNFTNASPWLDELVRSYAGHYALTELLEREEMDAWILDDTGFLKQGTRSVGVKRQYTGTAGKITNCQVAVSLTVATRSQHLPLDMELYLPEEWTEDKARRAEAKIPKDVVFRTKPEMALDMIAKWVLDDVPLAPLSADSGYGYDGKFRGGVTQMGFRYTLGVHSNLLVRLLNDDETVGPELSVEALARSLSRKEYKKVAWLEGTKKTLCSRFAYVRVELVHPDTAEQHVQGLLIEWPEGEKGPEHYTLVTLPRDTPLKEVVRRTKARWHVEGGYEDMKGELGLDHFEGRSWIGWNHHVSVVLATYALTVACKTRAFPPSASGSVEGGADEGADHAPLRRFFRHSPSRPVAARGALAARIFSRATFAGDAPRGAEGARA